jgi:hydrogenase nickel incorporation protein HypB
LKYPPIFYGADIAVLTKSDLAEAVEFDWDAAEKNIHAVHPGMPILRVSAKTGCGMREWQAMLAQLAQPRD